MPHAAQNGQTYYHHFFARSVHGEFDSFTRRVSDGLYNGQQDSLRVSGGVQVRLHEQTLLMISNNSYCPGTMARSARPRRPPAGYVTQHPLALT
jgi:hypothetical protein